MSSNLGLSAMSGLFLTWMGSAVSDSRSDKQGAMWFKLAAPPGDHFRQAAKKYLKEHNKAHGTSLSIAFPNPYRMVLKESRSSGKASGRSKGDRG